MDCDQIANELMSRCINDVDSMHGGQQQARRTNAVNRFRSSETRVLIATSVLNRGIDIPDITHVVNFEVLFFH